MNAGERRILAVSGMTAFEAEAVESCRSLGIVPADLFRPVSLVDTRPACAKTCREQMQQHGLEKPALFDHFVGAREQHSAGFRARAPVRS